MSKTRIYVVFMILLIFPFHKEALNLKKETTNLNCQKKLIGVFEYIYPNPGQLNITDVKIIYTKNEIYTFKSYPNYYFVECIEWISQCTYKTYKCKFHDPILDAKTEDMSISDEQFTKIDGNKYYFKRFKNQKLTNEDYITKISNEIPADFQ